MTARHVMALGLRPWALGLLLTLIPAAAPAQGAASFRERTVTPVASGEWSGSRLADGQPDVQGH